MNRETTRRALILLLVGVLAVAGCATGGGGSEGASDRPGDAASTSAPDTAATPSGEPSGEGSSSTPEPSSTPTPDPARADATIQRIPKQQWQRITAAGVWRPGCPVGRHQLRRVEVNFVDFSGEVRRGALVVNRDVAPSIARLFTKLFRERFPIHRMRPVEAYDGDSNASLRAGNTSAFNCRRPTQINAPVGASPHAHGRAIDINPRQNPWIDLRCDCWFPSARNKERTPGPGKINKGGLVWRAFTAEGWIWQNIDVPDYMHFDTGYPSKPFGGN